MQKNHNIYRNSNFFSIMCGLFLLSSIVSITACKEMKQRPSQNKIENLISVRENNSKVNEYVSFIANEKSKMTLDHALTNTALVKLADATDAFATAIDVNMLADIAEVRRRAENITNHSLEGTHSDDIRKSSDIITYALQNLQKAKYPGLRNDIIDLRKASTSIVPGVLALKQQKAIKTFFIEAANILEKMN